MSLATKSTEKCKAKKQTGFTLVEVVIALLLLGTTIGGMLSAFVMGRISTYNARYHAQAMNLIQAKAEELSADTYDKVQSEGPIETPLDYGPDKKWDTDDDLIGTLEVEVGDLYDQDADGETKEQEIDLDGDGKNDQCKPVRVSFAWSSLAYGGQKQMRISVDTMIAKR